MSAMPPLPPPLPQRPWAQRCSWASAGVGFAVGVGAVAATPLLGWLLWTIAPDTQYTFGISMASTFLLPLLVGVVLAVVQSTRWIGIWCLIFVVTAPIVAAGACIALFAGLGAGIGG